MEDDMTTSAKNEIIEIDPATGLKTITKIVQVKPREVKTYVTTDGKKHTTIQAAKAAQNALSFETIQLKSAIFGKSSKKINISELISNLTKVRAHHGDIELKFEAPYGYETSVSATVPRK